MNAYTRAIAAEVRKLRGTLALRMAFVAPLLVLAVLTLQWLTMDLRGPRPVGEAAWSLYSQSALGLWVFLMLPLYVTLQAALLAQLEHAHHQWKHLLALPLPRGSHLLAKLVLLIGLVALASAIVWLGIPLGGALLAELRPALGIRGPAPWQGTATTLAATLPAALAMVGLQWWIALRWPSFTVAVAVGMGATVAGYLIGQSLSWGPWYPWSLAVWTLGGEGQKLPHVLAVGLIGGGIAILAALWDLTRRDPA